MSQKKIEYRTLKKKFKTTCIYSFLNDKKYAKNVESNNLVHEKTFRLSSRTPRILFNVLSKTSYIMYRNYLGLFLTAFPLL